jgi:hypothetical protein
MGSPEQLMVGRPSVDDCTMERTRRGMIGSGHGTYQNLLLTAIAVVLVLGLIDRGAGPGSEALAQPEMGGLSNALEQRKQIIAELRTLNARMERIESKLAAGLNVKVTDMPALKLPDAKAGKDGKTETKPEARVEAKTENADGK